MANNYLQFSFAVPLGSEEAVQWVNGALEYVEAYRENDGPPSSYPADSEWHKVMNPGIDYVGFSAEFVPASRGTDELWIYAEEAGDPDHPINLVQEYLARFDPNGFVAYEWSASCSKPRPDEFFGGAVFVTANDVEFWSGSTWIQEKVKEHNARRAALVKTEDGEC